MLRKVPVRLMKTLGVNCTVELPTKVDSVNENGEVVA